MKEQYEKITISGRHVTFSP